MVPLEDVHVIEGTKAILECKVSAPDVSSSKWYLNDNQIKPDERVQAVCKGAKQRLVLTRTHASDAGRYKLMVGKVETSCNVTVEGWCLLRCTVLCEIISLGKTKKLVQKTKKIIIYSFYRN